MITVSTKRLIEAIEEAEAFALPEMSAGTDYLYHNLCGRLLRDEDVSLSSLDFSAFELDDVSAIEDIYSNVLEAHERHADGISRSLWNLSPITAAVFV